MVIECQKMFNFLPLKYQVDIRTASFVLRFISSENTICHLFVSHAALALNSKYNRYGGLVGSIQSLKDAIVSQFWYSWLFLPALFVCCRVNIIITCSVSLWRIKVNTEWKFIGHLWAYPGWHGHVRYSTFK